MVFQLHIWGPAFGLPSIDPECIATVAYFNRIVPRGEWTLVADYDTSISPECDFPVLLDDGVKTTGFTNIVNYLRNHHSGAYDLDYNLTYQQQTERTAFISFLQSIARPLVDLSLYVSSENYNSLTSSAYTAILPWYTNYTIPPKRRDMARVRTAHMGLSSLDVDECNPDTRGPGSGTASSEYEAAKRAAGIPGNEKAKVLSMGRGKGLGGLLSTPIYAARFKLDALSSELLEPLSDLLGKNDFLMGGDKPSSLDCLAFGYLALMLYPPVTQSWLKEAIQAKHPRILRYIRRLREVVLLKEEVDPAEVWSISSDRTAASSLPWCPRQPRAILSHVSMAAGEIAKGIPLLSAVLYRIPAVQDCPTEHASKKVPSSLPSPIKTKALAVVSATVGASCAGLALYHRRNPREGPLIFWALRQQTAFAGFGEAESLLSVLAGQLPK